ncbi:ABC-2 family transporter protein, partial [Candidatus Woesebacteria bacterium]|nr:ABC-2 family transporter protein [Candidatus Woesebacteria bacterium]
MSIKKYLDLYALLFGARVQVLFAFRLNAFVHFFYGPAYMIVLFFVQQLAYQRAPELGGWNREEATLLIGLCFFLYTVAFIFYIIGFRSFLWQGLREGVLDQYLTKPVSPLFFIAWGKP